MECDPNLVDADIAMVGLNVGAEIPWSVRLEPVPASPK
jgi:hypothetical protein